MAGIPVLEVIRRDTSQPPVTEAGNLRTAVL